MTKLDLLEILMLVGFSATDIEQFKQGKLLNGVLESTNDRELAAKFGCTITAPVSELKHFFLTGKRDHDSSAFQVGTMEELSDFKLEPNREAAAKMYINQASDLNLSPDEWGLFHGLKKADQVEDALRQVLKARYEQYLELGLGGILPYGRGGKKTYDPGAELKLKLEKAEILKKVAPQFYDCLNHYPNKKPEGLEEAFSWVNFTIDDKPTVCLVHKMGMMEGDVYIFSQIHFFVSRGHNSVFGVGGAFPLNDKETAIIYGSRT